jgi:hypothetical protein
LDASLGAMLRREFANSGSLLIQNTLTIRDRYECVNLAEHRFPYIETSAYAK